MANKIKPLDDDNILEFLQSSVRSSSGHDDPITRSRGTYTLDQLQPYELNPRQTRNPKYHEIKESIRAIGLKSPPDVTRRNPDDEKLSIRDGGNTRLEILWELYQEYREKAEQTQDADEKQALLIKADSFYRIECDFVPFHSDLDSLSAHMVENESRGDMIFIERALAVERYKQLFRELDEQEALAQGEIYEHKDLSSRKLAERISKTGWIVNQSHIVRYNYAANTLLEAIPTALWNGSGQSVVRSISSLYNAYEILWKATEAGEQDPEHISVLFYGTLKDYDDEQVDLDGFKQSLDLALSELTGLPAMAIMTEITALLANSRKSLKHEPDALRQAAANSVRLSEPAGTPEVTPPAPEVSGSLSSLLDNTQTTLPSAAKQAPSSANTTKQTTTGSSNQNSGPRSESAEPLAQPMSIGDLRTQIIEQVQQIAAMAPAPGVGLTILDNPSDPLQKELIDEHVYFDVADFVLPDALPAPRFPDDLLRTAIWWQLQKAAQDYVLFIKNRDSFTDVVQGTLASFIQYYQRYRKENHLTEVILMLEHELYKHPEILSACCRLSLLLSQHRSVLNMSDFSNKEV